MHQHRNSGADDGGSSRECAKRNGPPGFVDDEPHQEAAEEELFDDRNDEREAEEADGQEDVRPGWGRRQFDKWVERRAVTQAEEFLETKRGEELALEL